jgi:hypothetical protein
MNKYQSQTFLFPSFELMVRTGYLALLWFNRCHGVKRRTLHFESLSLSQRFYIAEDAAGVACALWWVVL